MKTQVYLTVDTEASIAGCFSDPGRYPPLLREPVYGYVDGQSQGLGFILNTLAHYKLVATFFVESLQARYFGVAPMARVAEQIQQARQDLQLHVHPCWTNFHQGRVISTRVNDHSTGRPLPELTAIFKEAIERFEALGVGKPVALRTGNFSVGRDTFKALHGLGIRASSNIASAIAPAVEPELRLPHGIHNIEGVVELPLTSFHSYSPLGRPTLRNLAVTACSFSEMRRVLEQAHQQQLGAVCILTHPFEFIKRQDFRYRQLRRHGLNQQRFRALCHYLNSHGDRFETRGFEQLDKGEVARPGNRRISLSGGYFQSLLRAGNNYCYDRFG